jgi:hypothetical protein
LAGGELRISMTGGAPGQTHTKSLLGQGLVTGR